MRALKNYTIALVVVRFLLPIATVVLLALTGLDLTLIGLPVISALLATAIAGRTFARQVGSMPKLQTLFVFCISGSAVFFVVNYTAYFVLAITGIGPVEMHVLEFWYETGSIFYQMAFLTSVAFLANSILFPVIVKAELLAMARNSAEQENNDAGTLRR